MIGEEIKKRILIPNGVGRFMIPNGVSRFMIPGTGRRRLVWPPCLAALGWLLVAAGQFSEPLPPEEAFPYIAVAEAHSVVLSFQIPEGYYLYRHRFEFESRTDGIEFDAPELPEGRPHVDEFFGAVEIYRGDLQIRIPYRRSGPASDLELRLQLQGCADIGFCYVPITWDKRVTLPGAG